MKQNSSSLGSFALATGLMMFLSGCAGLSFFQFGSEADQSLAQSQAPQTEIEQATPTNALPVLATECPVVKIRQNAESYQLFADNNRTDSGLQYQAVLTEHSRNCLVSDGQIAVKIGMVGRLLTGPSGGPATVSVPLRVAVERDGLAVFSEKYVLPVTIQEGEQSQDFIKVVDRVSIPYIGGEDITIWVGFDPRV